MRNAEYAATPMINQTAEHALRAVLYLARQPGREPVVAERIAAALGAPTNYLSKTLHQLVRQGVLSSTRGRTGGFRLVARPAELSIADVVGGFAATGSGMCLLGDRNCTGAQPCVAHERWEAVRRLLEGELRRTTIADLLGQATAGVDADGRDADPPGEVAGATVGSGRSVEDVDVGPLRAAVPLARSADPAR